MTSGDNSTDVIIDRFDDTCYTVTSPTQSQTMLHHFTLSVDNQGDDAQLTVVVMASEITQCSLMNIFYSIFTTAVDCHIHKQCKVVNDIPGVHYANKTYLVTCTFDCTCAAAANRCEVFAYRFHREQGNDWKLCETFMGV